MLVYSVPVIMNYIHVYHSDMLKHTCNILLLKCSMQEQYLSDVVFGVLAFH